MEIVLRVAFEDHKVIVRLKVILADDAFHPRFDLIVVLVDHMKEALHVLLQGNILRSLSDAADLVLNLLHPIDNFVSLVCCTHQLSHMLHQCRLETFFDSILQVLSCLVSCVLNFFLEFTIVFFI